MDLPSGEKHGFSPVARRLTLPVFTFSTHTPQPGSPFAKPEKQMMSPPGCQRGAIAERPGGDTGHHSSLSNLPMRVPKMRHLSKKFSRCPQTRRDPSGETAGCTKPELFPFGESMRMRGSPPASTSSSAMRDEAALLYTALSDVTPRVVTK